MEVVRHIYKGERPWSWKRGQASFFALVPVWQREEPSPPSITHANNSFEQRRCTKCVSAKEQPTAESTWLARQRA